MIISISLKSLQKKYSDVLSFFEDCETSTELGTFNELYNNLSSLIDDQFTPYRVDFHITKYLIDTKRIIIDKDDLHLRIPLVSIRCLRYTLGQLDPDVIIIFRIDSDTYISDIVKEYVLKLRYAYFKNVLKALDF